MLSPAGSIPALSFFLLFYNGLCCSLSFFPFSPFSRWLGVLITMAFLFFILVVLLNILIAQLSATYADVQADAQRELERNWGHALKTLEKGPLKVNKSFYLDAWLESKLHGSSSRNVSALPYYYEVWERERERERERLKSLNFRYSPFENNDKTGITHRDFLRNFKLHDFYRSWSGAVRAGTAPDNWHKSWNLKLHKETLCAILVLYSSSHTGDWAPFAVWNNHSPFDNLESGWIFHIKSNCFDLIKWPKC